MDPRHLRVLIAGAGAVASVFAVGLVLLLVTSVLVASNSINTALAACAPTSSGGPTPLQDPTTDEVAGAIYAQAMGLGLGEVAAIIGIGVGLGETGLSNDTDGDCWYGSCSNGHTSSRGVFQQFWSWPPKGTAWSGQKGPTGGPGTPYDQFNASNAWGANGWAVSDPRMNVAQAANMFYLGPDYGATMGLEDNKLFQSLRTRDPLSLSSGQMVQVAQQVQQFPAQHMGSYETNMTNATSYFKRIKSGEIAVPAFTPPLDGMRKSATTEITKKALGGTASAPATSVTLPQAPALPANANGLLLVGDSLMEGVATLGGVPADVFNGKVVGKYEVGIGTKAAIDKWGKDISSGPSRVLVSLGSNDAAAFPDAYGKEIDRLMGLAGENRQVYWYSLHYAPVAPLDVVLRAKADQYPNLTLVDVNQALAPEGGFVSASDKYLHPSTAGYQEMWRTAEQVMSGAAGGDQANLDCVPTGGSVATGPLQQRALQWALAITGGRYMNNNDWTPDPSSPEPPTWPDYNCSTMTAAAYRFASGDKIRLFPLSGEQWLDTTNITLVPFSQAQPGDIFFEYTGGAGGSDARVGHVGLIVDVNGGEQAIWHACGASSCQSNGNIGIGYSSLDHVQVWMTVSDPSKKDLPSERAKFLKTSDRNQAYVGRVIATGTEA